MNRTYPALTSLAIVTLACAELPREQDPEIELVRQTFLDPTGCGSVGCGGNSPDLGDGAIFTELSTRGQERGGVKIASVRHNGVEMDLLVQDDTMLVKPRGTSLPPSPAQGIHFPPDGESAGLRIQLKYTPSSRAGAPSTTYELLVADIGSVKPWTSRPAEIPVYGIYYRKVRTPGLAVPEGKVPFEDDFNSRRQICGSFTDEDAGAHPALIFTGDSYDGSSMSVRPADSTWFNISCLGSAPAKMHLTGHTQAAARWLGSATPIPQRTAMLKVLTATYCPGSGSMTTAGQPLRFRDYANVYGGHMPLGTFPELDIKDVGQVDQIEGLWSESGAFCVDRPRARSQGELKAVCPSVPGCDIATSFDPGDGIPYRDHLERYARHFGLIVSGTPARTEVRVPGFRPAGSGFVFQADEHEAGAALTARDFHEAGLAVPELPAAALADYIRDRADSALQAFFSTSLTDDEALRLSTPAAMQAEWTGIKRAIDEGRLASFALIHLDRGLRPKMRHLLAWGYDALGPLVRLYVYDPKLPRDNALAVTLALHGGSTYLAYAGLTSKAITTVPYVAQAPFGVRDGDTLVTPSRGTHVIVGGARFALPAARKLQPGEQPLQVADAVIDALGSMPRDGTVLREEDSSDSYVVHGGTLFPGAVIWPLPGPGSAPMKLAKPRPRAPSGSASRLMRERPSLRSGTVFRRASEPKVYVVNGFLKHHITHPAVLEARFGGWSSVVVIPDRAPAATNDAVDALTTDVPIY